MAPKAKRPARPDPLEPYRRVRKPMPPPERVVPDRRREVLDKEAEREAREAEGRRRTSGE